MLVSAIVISTRSGPALDAALRSLAEQDHRPLEIVLFGNGSDLEPPGDLGVPVRQGRSAQNLGVAGGRNAAAELAEGELLMFLDDDAVLRPGSVSASVEVLSAEPHVGAVAFRVIDPPSGKTAVWYYHRDPAEWGERAWDAPFFVGGGHMIRRELWEALGGFWDGYFREMEEIDFSWRLIDQGVLIRYDPRAAFEHPEITHRAYEWSTSSNVLMLWRLLPAGLALRQTLVKLPLFGWRALREGELRHFLRGLVTLAKKLPRALRERRPLKPETVDWLRREHGHGGIGRRLQWSLRAPADPAPDEPR